MISAPLLLSLQGALVHRASPVALLTPPRYGSYKIVGGVHEPLNRNTIHGLM